MKEKKLNCKSAKNIDLLLYLEKNGFKAERKNQIIAWFLSPFRDEKTASFKVDINKNIWYDFSEGCGGTIIDFIMKHNNCSVKEALAILENDIFSFHQQPKLIRSSNEPNYEITKVGKLEHPSLISYIQQRKLNFNFTNKYCFQVHYTFNNHKEYYGVGFLNDSGGFEIRNKYFKGCLGKKNITSVNNNSNVVSIFESWSDYISYLTYLNTIPNENFIILNSTALVKKAAELITDFKIVKCFFDNDTSGKRGAEVIKENCNGCFKDRSSIYKNYNDFNEYLMSNK